MVVTALLCLLLLGIWILFFNTRPKFFPPGPAWLPIVGNSLQVNRLSKQLGGLHLALLHLSKQWKTDVLGLKLGKELVVTVFTYPIVKTVLSSEDYEARPENFFLKLRCLGNIKGITCTSGEFWSIQRNFTARHIRTVRFGKEASEQLVQEEVNDILVDIGANEDTKVGNLIAPAVISILWSFITGTRLARNNVRLSKLLDLFETRSKAFDISGGLLAQHPWVRFIAPEKTGFNLIKRINRDLKELFMETIEEHHRTWVKGMEDSDLIYSFITEMKRDDAHYSFTDEQLRMLCLDLFIAAAQTTSSTLDFAFVTMLNHPDIQQKVQTLLDQAVDKHNAVSYSDKQRLPYIEAVLAEVQRYRTVVPLTGPRRVSKNVILGGYLIPKDTTVFIHTYSVHMDPTIWEEPHTFRPERFLSSDGKFINCEHLIPFGLGRRRCIGESLAKTCIFIYFTEILRNYSIVKSNKSAHHSKKPLAGITLSAEYSARFVSRNYKR